MPTEDEIRIILNVVNQDKIDQARAAIEQEEEAIRKLSAALAAGAITQSQFDAAAARSAQAIQAQSAAIKAAGGSFNGRALMEFSRAAEDAQYGLAGVLNNIPGLVAALGGSSGLVGVISLAAVGAYQLYKHADDLARLFGGGSTLSEAAAMEELAKKTGLSADERERLNRANAPGEKARQIDQGQTETESKQEQNVTKAIIEAGPAVVAQALLKKDPTAFDAAIPGIADKDGKLLQNERGENRTPQSDLADAQRKLDDYTSGTPGMAGSRNAAGDFVAGDLDPSRFEELKVDLDKAKRALEAARLEAGKRTVATSALPRQFPGALQKLRDAVDADPTAFGPGGRRLSRDLKEAAKTPDDIEEEKAQAHLEEQERNFENRRAEWEEKGRRDEEEEEKKAQLHLEEQERQHRERLAAWEYANEVAEEQEDKKQGLEAAEQERQFQEKLANWRFQAQEQIDNEDMGAQNADAMGRWREEWDRTHKGAQTLTGATALHDAIQGAVRGPTKDPTAVEQLAVQREIAANTKRALEQRQGAARAG